MNKFILALGIALLPQISAAQLCEARGYTIGFFNGVGNTVGDAAASLNAIRREFGSEIDGEPVRYEMFYNVSSLQNGANLPLQDIAETFIQRANEIDESGMLAERFYLALENARNAESFLDLITTNAPLTTDLGAILRDAYSTFYVAALSNLLSDPPSETTIVEQLNLADSLALEGQKILMVAHSQGNLFANIAYDHLQENYSTDQFESLHIAPASPTVRGAYVLNDNDLIINGLRLQGAQSVQPNNVALPFTTADVSGHGFIPIYLDRSRAGALIGSGSTATGLSYFRQLGAAALEQLQAPDDSAALGSFTATLTWDIPGDVDLHIFEPDGEHVFYADRTGDSGEIDRDDTVGVGPEHYFASCDSEVLQTGIYRLGINNFNASPETNATLSVSSPQGGGGVLASTRITVGPTLGFSGNNSPTQLLEVDVIRDAEGRTTITAGRP